MTKGCYRSFGFLVCFGILFLSGCDLWDKMMGKRGESVQVKRSAISVETMAPIRREVVDYEEFTGDTHAVENVVLQAQVSGILTKCDFTEGEVVKKNDVLFEIEPELYQAELDTGREPRERQRRADRPQGTRTATSYRGGRNTKLVRSNAVSQSDYDRPKPLSTSVSPRSRKPRQISSKRRPECNKRRST